MLFRSFFLIDLASVLPSAAIFILNSSLLGGPDVLGGADGLGTGIGASDTLVEMIGVNQFGNPTPPLAIIATVGLTLSPTTNLVQAISGIAYCNAPAATAQFTMLTSRGDTVLLTAIWNGRTNVNVNYGAAR